MRVSDSLGRLLTLAYDANGRLTSVSDGQRTVLYEYSGGNLSKFTDALVNVTAYNYDSANAVAGLLVTRVRPEGNTPYSQTYDSSGRVATQVDAAGNAHSFSYAPGATTITDPAGNSSRDVHAAFGQLLTHSDESNRTFNLAYDSARRLISVRDRTGGVTRHTYHEPSGKYASIIHPDGSTITFAYSPRTYRGITFYDLTRVAWPDNTADVYTYDASGNLIRAVDQAGKTWSYTHNSRGQLLSVTNPTGGRTSYTYSADATLASVRDHFGNVDTFAYDSLRRLISVTHADGSRNGFEFDSADRLLSVTNELGKKSTFTYDKNGNVSSAADPLGNVWRMAYDGREWLSTLTDPSGETSRRGFDKLGRLAAWTDRTGNTIQLGYDAPGHLVSIRDAAGNLWTRGYNPEGALASVNTPLGNAAAYTADALQRITRVTTPQGLVHNIKYDSMGRVVEWQDPANLTTIYGYEARGRLKSATLPGGISSSYSHNDLGRIASVVDPNGSPWQYRYDEQGRPTSNIDPLGNQTTFEYDNRSRVAKVNYPGGGSQLVSYDAVGAVTRRRYSDGTAIDSGYDDNRRLTAASGIAVRYNANGRLSECNGIGIARDKEGRVATLTLAPGKQVSYSYNSRGLLTQVADWLNGQTTLVYDADGRLTSLARPNGITTTYSYDRDGRLVSIRHGGAVETRLTLDARGQIATAERSEPAVVSGAAGAASTASYDAASQLSAASYDALGRLLNDGRRSLRWDLAGRLTGYSAGNDSVEFSYDAAGQRLTRLAAGVARSYVWNYSSLLPTPAIERDGSTDHRYYVHTPDGKLLYSVDARNQARRFYHFNESGSTIMLTDDGGAVSASYAYTPYGVIAGGSPAADNLFTFGGEYGVMQEGSSGLYYARARYYDASAARFLTRDTRPALAPKSVNPYQYADQNPAGAVDATGFDRQIIIGGHEWIKVDVYDAAGNVTGQMSLHFAPQGGGSDFTLNNPRTDFYPTLGVITIKSTQLEDELLLLHWRKLAAEPNGRKWNPIFNCAWASYHYAYADATLLEPGEALERAKRDLRLPATAAFNVPPPDPWYKRLYHGAGDAWDTVEEGISWLAQLPRFSDQNPLLMRCCVFR
ncbi:MAG: RHS repeat-associated core domain-containing protein [Acidobacteriota bacterium]